jgi:hypothetical protein
LREREITTGDIVEFQFINANTISDQRFRIQHKTGFIELTFDEVRQFYIRKDSNQIFCSTIKVGSRIFQMFTLSYEQFINLVVGKRFRIYVDNDMYSFKDISDIHSLDTFKYKVLELSLMGDVTATHEMINTTCYQFEEAVIAN